MKNDRTETLRTVYLYAVSFAGVLMIIFGIIGFSNSIIDLLIKDTSTVPNYNNIYALSSIARETTSTTLGILILIYHWNIIKKEHRIGKRELSEANPSMNFWEALFFYILSFTGILLFSLSLASLAGAFFSVQYPTPFEPLNPGEKIPTETAPIVFADIRLILQRTIQVGVGFVLWIISWLRIQSSHMLEKNESK